MSERETLSGDSVQRWKGVNQRTQPTLVEDGFFTGCTGLYFNTDGVIRLNGKKLAGNIGQAVFMIFQLDKIALLQTTSQLLAIPIEELLGFSLIQLPGVPQTPVVTDISYTTLNLHGPTSYPAHTLSFSLQQRTIRVDTTDPYPDLPSSWSNVDDGSTAPNEVYSIFGAPGLIWEFRGAATNVNGTTYSQVARVQHLWVAPGLSVPTFSNLTPTDFSIVVPAIPSVTLFTLLLLTGADPANFAHYTAIGGAVNDLASTNNTASTLMTVTDGSTYTFRLSYSLKTADDSFVALVGAPASLTLPSLVDRRIDSDGNIRVDSAGNNRIMS